MSCLHHPHTQWCSVFITVTLLLHGHHTLCLQNGSPSHTDTRAPLNTASPLPSPSPGHPQSRPHTLSGAPPSNSSDRVRSSRPTGTTVGKATSSRTSRRAALQLSFPDPRTVVLHALGLVITSSPSPAPPMQAAAGRGRQWSRGLEGSGEPRACRIADCFRFCIGIYVAI